MTSSGRFRVNPLACQALVFVALMLVSAPSAKAGMLDPSFGEGGRVVREGGEGASPGLWSSTQVALAPDGTIYAISQGELMSFLPGGKTNRAFGERGRVALRAWVPRLLSAVAAVDREGRLVVAGSVGAVEPMKQSQISGRSAFVARLLPNGSLDPSFGDGGIAFTDLGFGPPALPPLTPPEYAPAETWVEVVGVAVDRADRIVLTGTHNHETRVTKNGVFPFVDCFVARLTANGQVDSSFGERGVFAIENLPEIGPPISTREGSFALATNGAASYLLRLDSHGQPDAAFAHAGWRKLPAQTEQQLIHMRGEGVGLFSIAGGYRPGTILLQRVLPNGSIDRHFGHGGVARIRFGDQRRFLYGTAADDRAGGFYLGSTWKQSRDGGGARSRFLVAHVTRRGTLDRRFGRIATGFGVGTAASLEALSVDRQGRLLAAGAIDSPLLHHSGGLAMARYGPPG